MALKWFRRHQKSLLIPLAVVIIITFVFLPAKGLRSSPGSRTDAIVGGDTISKAGLQEYVRALRLMGYRESRAAAMKDIAVAFLQRAKAAENAGIVVTPDQIREAIRSVVQAYAGREGSAALEYRKMLDARNVSSPVFEETVAKELAWQMLASATGASDYITEMEYFIAYRQEKDRIRYWYKDFSVADFRDSVEEPTEDEISGYYERHKDLSVEDDLALATDPEVAIEYGLVEKKTAGRVARFLRNTDIAVRVEGLLAGPAGGLAGRLAAQTVSADHEKRVLDRYERDKNRLYVIRPPRPKRAGARPKARPAGKGPRARGGKGEGAEEGTEESKERRRGRKRRGRRPKKDGKGTDARPVSGVGVGLASMIALPALGAAAPEEPAEPEGPAEPEEPARPEGPAGAPGEPPPAAGPAAGPEPPPAPPPKQYKLFEKVRKQVEDSVDTSLAPGAAREAARRIAEIAKEWAEARGPSADAILAGVALASLPGLRGSSGLLDRIEFARACEEAGAVHGVTTRRKVAQLRRLAPLGNMSKLADEALRQAKQDGGDSIGRAMSVGNGGVSWRVADYLPARTRTLEEAREDIRERIIHERAAKLADADAREFQRSLVAGDVSPAGMDGPIGPISVTSDLARPFAYLADREPTAEPVALDKRSRPVEVNENRRAWGIARDLLGSHSESEAVSLGKELAKEAVHQETHRYRVAALMMRESPDFEDFKKDAGWRKGSAWRPGPKELMGMVRSAFVGRTLDDLRRQVKEEKLWPREPRRRPSR